MRALCRRGAYDPDEIAFNLRFFDLKPMRALGDVRADMLMMARESEGRLFAIVEKRSDQISNVGERSGK